MAVKTTTIIYTIYKITCDYCGCVEMVDNSRGLGRSIYNRILAVRSLGWALQRGDKVMCRNCRCYNRKRSQ